MSSFFCTCTPGRSRGTMKQETPLWPFDLSVCAKTTNHEATPPFVIHCFVPVRTYLSPFFTATDFMPSTSEPADGSERQYAAHEHSSVRRPKNSFFCASLAERFSGWQARLFATTGSMIPAQP